MKKIIEIIEKFKSLNPNLVTLEDETKLTIDFVNLDISNNFISDVKNVCKDYSNFNADACNLFSLEGNDDFKDYIDNTNSYNVSFYLDKRKCIKKYVGEYGDKNIIAILDSDNYQEMFSRIIKNKNYIYVIAPENEYYYNENFLVTNVYRDYRKDIVTNSFDVQKIKNYRKKIIQVCNWNEINNQLIPESVNIDFKNQQFKISENIKYFLVKESINSIIKSIANFTETVDNIDQSKIISNKTINIKYNIEDKSYSVEVCEDLYSIYKWVYKDSMIDKITVVRSVVEALISAKWHKNCPNKVLDVILENTKWLKKSSEDNYNNIIRGNVEKHFEEKNKIRKSLKDNMESLSSSSFEIIKNINANMTAGLGAMIAGSFGYLAKKDFTMIKIVILVYGCYITINTLMNIPLIYIKKKQLIESLDNKLTKYKVDYLPDELTVEMEKQKKINVKLFNIYLIVSIVIVLAIDIISYKIISDIEFVKWIIGVL